MSVIAIVARDKENRVLAAGNDRTGIDAHCKEMGLVLSQETISDDGSFSLVYCTADQLNETNEDKLARLKKAAQDSKRVADKAWYAYYGECEVGPERIWAAVVYETIRTATRRF